MKKAKINTLIDELSKKEARKLYWEFLEKNRRIKKAPVVDALMLFYFEYHYNVFLYLVKKGTYSKSKTGYSSYLTGAV